LDDVKKSMQSYEAASMIGKTVTAVRVMTDVGSKGTNSLITGKVTKLSIKDGVRYLTIQGAKGDSAEVQMGALTEVSD
jgi:hypothetical protein